MAARIAVPADKVRTREQILDGQVIRRTSDGVECVWETCTNCGGSGNYPSSMIPPGKCRFYCWEGRTPATYGKRPIPVEKFVKREQAADRRAYRVQVQWEQSAPEREAQALLERELAHRDALEEDARRADEAARKAVSEWVGNIGERLSLDLTVTRVASFRTTPFHSYVEVTRYVVTLRDVSGNVFVWFSDYSREQGERLLVKATVKEHKIYQGEKQTTIQRVKEIVK